MKRKRRYRTRVDDLYDALNQIRAKQVDLENKRLERIKVVNLRSRQLMTRLFNKEKMLLDEITYWENRWVIHNS